MSFRYQRFGNFAQFDPPAYLQPYVDSFWFHATAANSPAPPDDRRRIIPDGLLGLTFIRKRDIFGAPKRGSVVFVGPATGAQSVKIVPGLEVVGVRLRPEWIETLLGIKPGDHVDAIWPMHRVLPEFAKWIEVGLNRTVRLDQVLLVIATFLNEQIHRRMDLAADPRRRHLIFDTLRHHRGAVSPAWLADRLEMTSTILSDYVARCTGLSIERLFAILRLQHALRICYYDHNPNWDDLAATCGYPDRSGMNHEVARLAGIDLEQLHRERRGLLDFANQSPDPAILSSSSLMTAISAIMPEHC